MAIVVLPGKEALKNGWDESDRFEWPGTLVDIVKTEAKTCLQFLIWDRRDNSYSLKCWNMRYLQTHDLQGDTWSFTDIGYLQNAIAEESLRRGSNSNNSEKVARSSNGYRGKHTKRRRR
ncbi:hypothetical protein SOP91_00155 (plasmid) [Enterobacter hormaechei]|uniref:hypothetical protein n=1 Tax=Enterobacter hormaechei TaxID=158836 RepID=UPI002B4BB8A0|nr:hypothetical protein [Enterobacter hormaechei]WRM07122.1 hypothetical protein SOP91_00155 [Enterobacter hormaechei]